MIEAMQNMVSRQVESIADQFQAADTTGTSIDANAVAALLRANELETALGELKGQVAALKTQINESLVEQFALLGVQNMNVNGSCVYRHVDRYANAKAEFRGQLVAWARENDLDDMIVLQPARFKSWCREQLESENARGLPPEIFDMVEIFERASLRIRKA